MSIHPLAYVHPEAKIGRNVEIGPFCVVQSGASIGDGCILESHVVVKSFVEMGENNHIFDGTIVGGLPQHANMPPHPGGVIIGSGNTIRENSTVHRALDEKANTVIGDNNLLMANGHVAHDCQVGSNIIFANNLTMAGHVTVEDRAYISGAVAIHQFCRIGSLAMLGGQAHVTKDVPPYVTVDGLSSLVVGLNQIGLRRAGYSAEDIRRLKAAYRVIYRKGLDWKDILPRLQAEFPQGPAARFYHFLAATTRGIVFERRLPPNATIKLRREPRVESPAQRKAG